MPQFIGLVFASATAENEVPDSILGLDKVLQLGISQQQLPAAARLTAITWDLVGVC